jgi:signal transduction histidine kinase
MLSMAWPRSVRARLTFVFVVVAGATIVVAAMGMYRQVEVAIWSHIDASLTEESDLLTTLPRGGIDLAHLVAVIAAERDLGPRKFVAVLDRDGHVLARAGRIPPRLLRSPPHRRAVTLRLWIEGSRRGFRIVQYHHAGTSVIMGIEATSALRTLAAMRWRLGLGGSGVLLILAALAWVVTSRATGELLRLTAEIEALQAGSLDRRVARRATLEVDQLVLVLNRLLARLETAVGHLRRFTADAAHELRTPVAALRATLEVALSRDAPERWREGLLDGLEQAERVGRLAENLLALSGVEAGARDAQRTPVRLDRLAEEVAGELEPIAMEQRRPMRCEPGDEVWVVGIPDLLRRVIANLIDNAFSHTPPTSAVTVRVRADGEWARVSVVDEGPGIAAEDRPRVFERFGRGRGASSKGAGLGLALSREVAERHGGTLEIDSDHSRGTTAVLSLPLVSAPAARATA